jgi:5-methylcytosine-specific restriction protein A
VVSALQLCATPRCTELVERGHCDEHRRAQRRAVDRRRPTARQRGYDAAWQRARAAYLAEHLTCECDDPACREPAVDVDHRDGLGPSGPRGQDPTNLRAMAHACHSRRTARDQPAGWHRPARHAGGEPPRPADPSAMT